jgi:short-subunit dehydrogenase
VPDKTMHWDGAVVVVTGASRGIGRAVAEHAARLGARVGLMARSRGELDTVLSSIGGRGAVATADVSQRGDVDAAVATLEGELGPTDVLVANAGIGAYGRFAEMNLDDAEHLIRVNLMGTVYAIRAVLPGMLERHRGRIAIVSSVAGRFGPPFEAMYGATKAAQIGLAEALSVEVAGNGVGVSIVNPGVVSTGFFEARGHAYDRKFPKQIPPERVAATVIRAIEAGQGEFFVPRAFLAALAVRHVAPRLYHWGTKRSFRGQL